MKKFIQITPIAAAFALLSVTAYSILLQAPDQKPAQKSNQTVVDSPSEYLPVQPPAQSQQPVAGTEPRLAEPLLKVDWPALGAGDFKLVAAPLPKVNWPALGAGDFVPAAIPLPTVNWPALGAGDFQTP